MSGLNTAGGNKVALMCEQYSCKGMFLEGLWTGRVCSRGQGASGAPQALWCSGSACAPGQGRSCPLALYLVQQRAKSLAQGTPEARAAFLGLQDGKNRLWLKEVC